MKATSTKSKLAAKKKIKENSFLIVAIGASAGGLEAMMELLMNLPPDTGMAFIYVQHLSPDHKSMLTEILSKKTKMKVQDIDDMDKIKPNNVYVIPFNKGIEVAGGRIKLTPRSESSTAISIDILFSSLAQAHKERVIGIVLSGTATDGTEGIKAIKHEGGLTFAQDDTAKFSSMPQSAIARGAVDFILSPKDIALELARLSKHPLLNNTKKVKSGKEELTDPDIHPDNPELKTILSQLNKTKGVDFSVYKMNTVKRRIIRRMLLYKIETLKEYAKLLTQKNEEIDILYQDLLINVTSFFRDTDTHKYLKENLFPKLIKRKKAGETLRIWVPACATGEEAYSFAMMLLEIQGSLTTNTPVQIFATDLSENAIDKARIGVYNKQELATVSPKRIQRFFTKADGNFRVNKAMRDMCVFAPHNILRDPPFSRLDFISCCNLFIYFDTAAQKKAIQAFHYALNPDGFLMLGKSENISQSLNLFANVNKKYKIFSRRPNSGTHALPSLSPRFAQQTLSGNNTSVVNPKTEQKFVSTNYNELDNAIDAVLVSEFMPACVVINHQMEIIQCCGTTDLFLTHPKGKATFNILKMARHEIAFELRNSISKVIKTKQRIRKSGIEMKFNTAIKIVSLEIVPLKTQSSEPLLLILFSEQEQADVYFQQDKGRKNTPAAIGLANDRRVKKLESELEAARSDALSISQEHEAFAEELQSANEEVVSSNEELQTVNEELETSTEEIESANEELTTTNQELQIRNELLSESYEYSEAIVNTMHEPMIVLGKDLRVKSANKAFYKKFNTTEEQTEGELLYNLGNKEWNIAPLRELLEDIIPKNSHFYNYEVRNTFLNLGEKVMSLNASRIIQKAHREHLILLVISDITEVRHLLEEKELREKELLNREIKERLKEKKRLENAVEERTRQLKQANESLEDKNTALESMNKELEAFTYVASHDLQEPIRKIQTFASIILEKENKNLSEKGKNYFRLMQSSAERMQQLIRDLLAFSHISATERKFENTHLSTIIEDVIVELKEAIERQQAVIDVNEMCEAKIIPFQFRQLMHNLLGNALKFSNPSLPPHITITCKNVKYNELNNANLPPQKEYCHIKIADNGIGFKEEFSEKIFEVFQKLHDREEYTGTGIGLAIVKKIVDNHNGMITATGEQGKGATFDIYIPTTRNDNA